MRWFEIQDKAWVRLDQVVGIETSVENGPPRLIVTTTGGPVTVNFTVGGKPDADSLAACVEELEAALRNEGLAL